MDKHQIFSLLKDKVNCEIKIDEPMKKHSTFKVGGNADIFAIPEAIDDIANIIKVCNINNIPMTIIGNGSNLIVRDKGIRGVVMQIFKKFSHIKVKGEEITAQSGILLSTLANAALEKNLTGLEFASGIPGTLGGAVTMNAGAYGGEMKDVVISTKYLDEDGNIHQIAGEEHKFSYRNSMFGNRKCAILESTIRLRQGDYNEIKSHMDDLNKKRKEKQPLNYPSAGSTFKRPEGFFAGKLIEDCGLKGYKIGGAMVSELHSGFLINYKNATSKDVIDLIKYVQESVKNKFSVELETEVKIIGEE